MKNIFRYSIFLLIGSLLTFSSCTKDWEEKNVSPNDPSVVPFTNILAHTIRYTGDVFYDSWQGMNNYLSYSGLVTKIQYIDEARYQYRGGTVNTAWSNYYVLQNDLANMRVLAKEQEGPYLEAVAITYSVFLWQMATDQWGDIPYSAAIDLENDVLQPAYDSQQAIYTDLFAKLVEANNLFRSAPSAAYPSIGAGDFVYGADEAQWQKWCNSLRLRLAIRISKVDPATARTNIEQILGDPATYPIFTSNADNAQFAWPGVAPYKEPWAADNETRDDHGMAKTLIDDMLANADPRLPIYADTLADGTYAGAIEGGLNSEVSTAATSRIGKYFRKNTEGYTYFQKYPEVMFIIAEAALNGWNTGAWTAQSAYEAGITASMSELDIAAADITTYMEQTDIDWNGGIVANATQIAHEKWIALFKMGQEAWAEQRRVDYPLMGMSSGSLYKGHNRQPFRYPYPTDEANLNSANNSAAAVGVVDDFWGKQMWWDTRTGVN